MSRTEICAVASKATFTNFERAMDKEPYLTNQGEHQVVNAAVLEEGHNETSQKDSMMNEERRSLRVVKPSAQHIPLIISKIPG